jgi:drug/metabolite transporter (DMT)-like permease
MLSARLFAGGDARPRSLVMLSSACVTCLLASLVTGDVALPRTDLGIAALLGSSLLYMLAISAMLMATAALGPARVAMVMNVEPVASLVLTYLILGERLGLLQLAGAACVILAIIVFRPRGTLRR